MIVYLTGNTFQQIIHNSITDLEELVTNQEVSNEIDFMKFAKQSITSLESVDVLIIDISAFINTDDEIIMALEMIRTMYDEMKIIVLAAYRATGDELLTRCFNLGIWNIINTNDFVEIRAELQKCIKTGKSFKDAVKYKNAKAEKVIIKHEVKKTVNKKLVGITGTETNIGVTHNAIVLANYFRKKGYMVALAEMNNSNVFSNIKDEFDETEYEEGYFTLHGIDYYRECNQEKLVQIMEHSYNFIILDFGYIKGCDVITFEKCDERILISGSKPWEWMSMNGIFAMYENNKKALKKINFCYNFTPKSDYEGIKKGMGELEGNTYFLEYTEDPFSSSNFTNADEIFEEYLPEEVDEEKKRFGIFGRKKYEKAK